MAEHDLKSLKIGFIGGGNMASAIAAGLMRKNVLNPNNVWISTRTDRTFGFWKDLGVNITLENMLVIKNCDTIVIAVKPHVLDTVFNSIQKTMKHMVEDKLFISVLVGVSLDKLQRTLQDIVSKPRIIRSMPNTPMMVGEGITVYCERNATQEDLALVDSLFSHIGVCEHVSESMMNAIGGLSGSGPAYAYLIIEALADGAVKMGVPRHMATQYAAQVLVGAGKMVLQTGKHPGQLKDEVCSPGGSTITGVHAMERGQVRASMANAVEAAVLKSEELFMKFK